MKALLLIVVALFVVACSPYDSSSVKTEFGEHSTRVYEVRLEDGIRCAAHRSGAIDCDWGRESERP
jgi:hypothetical protein